MTSKADRYLSQAESDARYVRVGRPLPASILDQIAAVLADTTAPAVPANVAVTVASDGTTTGALAWTPNTESDLYRYEYRIGTSNPPTGTPVSVPRTQQKVTNKTVFAPLTGLAAGTTYYAQARAFDLRGNVSDWSAAVSATTAAAPAPLADSFTGANGAGWSSSVWTTYPYSGGTFDIQGNAGRVMSSAGYTTAGRAYLTGVAAAADRELALTVDTTNGSGFFDLSFRHDQAGAISGNSFQVYNGYAVQIDADAATITFIKVTNGTPTNLSPAKALPGAVTRFRVALTGSSLKIRSWAAGSAEPSSWDWTGTDTDRTNAALPLLSTGPHGNTTFVVDDLTVIA